jgi:glycosyltransferase involved in cell wall biosynthesis
MSVGRIVLFGPSLWAGGAERVMSILANAWAEQGREVTVLTLAASATDFYALAPSVRRVGLDVMADSAGLISALLNNARRGAAVRRAIRAAGPEMVISFGEQNNVLALFATRGLRCPVIVSERVDPSQHPAGALWERLRRVSYPWANAVAVQTEAVAHWVAREIGPLRTAVIPNPVRLLTVPPEIERNPAAPTLIAMGRLVPQKGFDLLIEAFARLADKHSAWRLTIVGEGALRGELEVQAARQGLAERVHFTGRVADPEAHLGRADVFVLSSRYEGFPNVLLEAMSLGLPVVSFDCPSGPSAIIRHREDGVLVPAGDVSALAAALDGVMTDAALRHRLGDNARAVVERFGTDSILARWDALMAGVVA